MHGRRLIFFLDDCSLELQGDSIEFCMQFVADPITCIQEIPKLCAKFTRDLWPLLSDWAPLEVASLPHRAPNVHLLCFRSLSAGLSPWRRPIQTQVGPDPSAESARMQRVDLWRSKSGLRTPVSPLRLGLEGISFLSLEVIRQFKARSDQSELRHGSVWQYFARAWCMTCKIM